MVPLRSGTPRFPLGRILMTPGAIAALQSAGENGGGVPGPPRKSRLGRVCVDDIERNGAALVDGERLVSAYTLRNALKIWIIT